MKPVPKCGEPAEAFYFSIIIQNPTLRKGQNEIFPFFFRICIDADVSAGKSICARGKDHVLETGILEK